MKNKKRLSLICAIGVTVVGSLYLNGQKTNATSRFTRTSTRNLINLYENINRSGNRVTNSLRGNSILTQARLSNTSQVNFVRNNVNQTSSDNSTQTPRQSIFQRIRGFFRGNRQPQLVDKIKVTLEINEGSGHGIGYRRVRDRMKINVGEEDISTLANSYSRDLDVTELSRNTNLSANLKINNEYNNNPSSPLNGLLGELNITIDDEASNTPLVLNLNVPETKLNNFIEGKKNKIIVKSRTGDLSTKLTVKKAKESEEKINFEIIWKK